MATSVTAQTQALPAPAVNVSKAVLFQNVGIFDGLLAKVSAPMSMLVLNNKIQTISLTPIAVAPNAQIIEGAQMDQEFGHLEP